ncbi:signal peptidase complex subunit 1-like isoform X2 [Wolffia australiana]
MDWQGQKLSETLMQVMLVAFAVIAFGSGYALGSFQTMMLVFAGGVILTTLVTVPNWPWFNRHPLKWLDPSEADRHPRPKPSTASVAKKKTSKSHQK